MQIHSNIHAHTVWSDGRDTMEAVVETALQKDFHTVGISDHSYTWFDERYCMRRGSEAAYAAELRRLRERYAGQIDVLTGIEYDLSGDAPDLEADYVIGSAHYVQIGGEYLPVDEDVPNFRRLLEAAGGGLELAKRYFSELAEQTIRVRPDVLGHFDLLTKFSMVEESDAYRDCAREALLAAIPAVTAVEVNTGAMARGLRQNPYPADFLLQTILEAGGQVILSSDAHRAEHLDFAFGETLERLRRLGFPQVLERRKGGFVPIAIA